MEACGATGDRGSHVPQKLSVLQIWPLKSFHLDCSDWHFSRNEGLFSRLWKYQCFFGIKWTILLAYSSEINSLKQFISSYREPEVQLVHSRLKHELPSQLKPNMPLVIPAWRHYAEDKVAERGTRGHSYVNSASRYLEKSAVCMQRQLTAYHCAQSLSAAQPPGRVPTYRLGQKFMHIKATSSYQSLT